MSENCSHNCGSCTSNCSSRKPADFLVPPNQHSNIKKVIVWYNLLIENGIVDFEEEQENDKMKEEYAKKVADFFGCELSAMFNEQASEEDLIICAFRINDISQEDAEQIAQFKGLCKIRKCKSC